MGQLARAAMIDDPQLRASFLGNVPENVRTAELAELSRLLDDRR